MIAKPEGIENEFDVVVIGGGPAGAALATICQCYGHKSLVLECATFPRYHIGESLIPNTYGTLDRLGLLPKMKKSHFPEKHSVRFVGPSGRESDPFYFSETIDGDAARTWQVERGEFDQLCLDNARSTGVDVRMETKVDRILFDGDRATGVRAHEKKNEPYDVKARVVVDASGRASIIGNQLGLKQSVPGLKKTSIWSYYKGGKRYEGKDAGETTIFMIPEQGWFWYIPMPDDVVSVGIVASPEYLNKNTNSYEDIFLREVDKCEPLSERLSEAERVAPVRGIKDLAYRNTQVAGDGWVIIGDAAAFLDPIYSSGLYLALGSAEMAADCIHDALEADDVSGERLGAYVPALMGGVEVIRRLIHAFYDPTFSFGKFVERFPKHRAALIDCLVGDVVNRDMDDFMESLAEMTPPPPPL